jgi:hypothetical protein
MAFWTSAASEPKRQHRFLIDFPLLMSADGKHQYKKYLARTFTKPSFTISETPHKFLGNTYHYPGTVTWEPCSATLVNSVDPDGNRILMDALIESGYLLPPTQDDAVNRGGSPGTVNKAAALGTLGEVQVDELDGKGDLVGRWKLHNAFLTSAKFGDLDYGGDELLNIDIGIRYDWATYVSHVVPAL